MPRKLEMKNNISELYIGFMSGTSCDGIDASLVKTNGSDDFKPLYDLHIPYPSKLALEIKNLCSNADSQLNVEEAKIERKLTMLHSDAAKKIMEKAGVSASEIKAIGFHGQTIYHNPKQAISLQIGDASLLSSMTAIDVIYNFRQADIEHGGQGAPLVPIFHQLLAQRSNKPAAIINIGGVANITYIAEGYLAAFDTGPGNALIDDAMQKFFGKNYDEDGAVAALGNVDMQIINQFLEHEYFTKAPPKSLDRNQFDFLIKLLDGYNPQDIIANLTYATANTIVRSINSFSEKPKSVYLCGGGKKNKTLIKWIAENSSESNIEFHNKLPLDINPDYVESQAFAYLAARFFQKLPSSFPSTTGAEKEVICGQILKSQK